MNIDISGTIIKFFHALQSQVYKAHAANISLEATKTPMALTGMLLMLRVKGQFLPLIQKLHSSVSELIDVIAWND